MDNKIAVHQGEILMLLAKRSRIDRSELAKRLGVNKNYLSNAYLRETISKKLKVAASKTFGVDESIFETGLYPGIPEDSRVEEPDPELEELKADVERLERENAELAQRLLAEQRVSEELRKVLLEIAKSAAGK